MGGDGLGVFSATPIDGQALHLDLGSSSARRKLTVLIAALERAFVFSAANPVTFTSHNAAPVNHQSPS